MCVCVSLCLDKCHHTSCVHPEFISSVGWVMNFGREVARQTSCYTYVIEDEDPALASRNVFEVRLSPNCMKNKLICCTENAFYIVKGQMDVKKTNKKNPTGLQKKHFKMWFFFFSFLFSLYEECLCNNTWVIQILCNLKESNCEELNRDLMKTIV